MSSFELVGAWLIQETKDDLNDQLLLVTAIDEEVKTPILAWSMIDYRKCCS